MTKTITLSNDVARIRNYKNEVSYCWQINSDDFDPDKLEFIKTNYLFSFRGEPFDTKKPLITGIKYDGNECTRIGWTRKITRDGRTMKITASKSQKGGIYDTDDDEAVVL